MTKTKLATVTRARASRNRDETMVAVSETGVPWTGGPLSARLVAASLASMRVRADAMASQKSAIVAGGQPLSRRRRSAAENAGALVWPVRGWMA